MADPDESRIVRAAQPWHPVHSPSSSFFFLFLVLPCQSAVCVVKSLQIRAIPGDPLKAIHLDDWDKFKGPREDDEGFGGNSEGKWTEKGTDGWMDRWNGWIDGMDGVVAFRGERKTDWPDQWTGMDVVDPGDFEECNGPKYTQSLVIMKSRKFADFQNLKTTL